MNRRQVIGGLACVAVLGARAARAQGRVYRIAVPLAIGNLTHEAAPQHTVLYGPVVEELRKAGFAHGESLRLEFWTADGHFDRMPEIAAAVVRSNPDAIFVASAEFAAHIRDATSAIPVVAWVGEAVADGFARSFSRPGGNVTGISWTAEYGIVEKWFDLTRQILPHSSSVAFLGPRNLKGTVAIEQYFKPIAHRTGFAFVEAYVDSPVSAEGYRRAFEYIREQKADAVMIGGQVESFACPAPTR